MSKHTEGKLELFYQDGKLYLECDTASGKVRLAEMSMGHRRDSGQDAAELVRRWNAHEDLLEACESLTGSLDAEHDDCDGSKSYAICYLINMGRAALAKAKKP